MKLSSSPRENSTLSTANYFGVKHPRKSLLPGLILTSLIAVFSLFLSRVSGVDFLNPLLISVLLGIGLQNLLPIPKVCHPGIQFTMKRVLRLAVILLGLRLSLADVLAVGPMSLTIVAATTVSTFYLTCWLGRCLGINRKLTQLIAAGTSICGASAVVATNAVVDSSEEDMAYAISTITGFGTLAMLLYPPIASWLQLSPQSFGIWCGASVHEVAQVIATAFQNGPASGEFATITKLSRVLLIIPIVFALGWQPKRLSVNSVAQASPQTLPIPWFVLFFVALVMINSLHLIPQDLKAGILIFNQLLLCMALAAMGLETKLSKVAQLGLKPIYLAGLSWLFLATTSLVMIQLLMGQA